MSMNTPSPTPVQQKSRGEGLWSDVKSGIHQVSSYVARQADQRRQERQLQRQQEKEEISIEPSARTAYDALTNFFLQVIGLLAPLIIALVLAIGNGYFFSGFHFFSWDPLIFTAYLGGFTLEAVGLGLVYRAARYYRKNDTRGMAVTFSWLLLLMLGSILAQFMFLQVLFNSGNISVPDEAVSRVPFFSMLVGVNGLQGHDLVFIVRALLLHLGELACSFIVVDKTKTAAQIILERREVHEAQMEIKRQNMRLELERQEHEQDLQLKKLQYSWLLAQVRRGTIFLDGDTDSREFPAIGRGDQAPDPLAMRLPPYNGNHNN